MAIDAPEASSIHDKKEMRQIRIQRMQREDPSKGHAEPAAEGEEEQNGDDESETDALLDEQLLGVICKLGGSCSIDRLRKEVDWDALNKWSYEDKSESNLSLEGYVRSRHHLQQFQIEGDQVYVLPRRQVSHAARGASAASAWLESGLEAKLALESQLKRAAVIQPSPQAKNGSSWQKVEVASKRSGLDDGAPEFRGNGCLLAKSAALLFGDSSRPAKKSIASPTKSIASRPGPDSPAQQRAAKPLVAKKRPEKHVGPKVERFDWEAGRWVPHNFPELDDELDWRT